MCADWSYPRNEVALFSISYVALGATLQEPFSFRETGMPDMGPHERQSLKRPDVASLLLLAPTEDQINAGLSALRAAGIEYDPVVEWRRVGDNVYDIETAYVKLLREPAPQ